MSSAGSLNLGLIQNGVLGNGLTLDCLFIKPSQHLSSEKGASELRNIFVKDVFLI